MEDRRWVFLAVLARLCRVAKHVGKDALHETGSRRVLLRCTDTLADGDHGPVEEWDGTRHP